MTAMTLPFTKMHGCGNDFVVLDATIQPFVPSPALLTRLTDRRFGVGCDQVLVVQAPSSPDVDFDYRIFNADGSEVGQCGNGARALARFIHERGLSARTTLTVQTRTARMTLERLSDGLVRVNMGVPRFAPAEIPLQLPEAEQYTLVLDAFGPVHFGVANFGNPHAVILVPDVDAAPVEALGQALQARAEFPQSVNVGFLQVQAPDHGRLRVYERGAGETLACGSGACAAFAVGSRAGLLGAQASLELRGGTLRLEWRGETTPVFMTGPAETVYQGELAWPS
jgi:diaminopimelate epimerase